MGLISIWNVSILIPKADLHYILICYPKKFWSTNFIYNTVHSQSQTPASVFKGQLTSDNSLLGWSTIL